LNSYSGFAITPDEASPPGITNQVTNKTFIKSVDFSPTIRINATKDTTAEWTADLNDYSICLLEQVISAFTIPISKMWTY
jgi:hypothetical protein